MSYFGDGTLKEDILQDVKYRQEQHDSSTTDIIAALAEVILYYAEEKG